ncbi:MAG TPA: Holliday junction branch migration protein RuvA [bacterium]|nr:Holliday junction branch migration protein RuvA [bacterium]
MIDFVKGVLLSKSPTRLVVEVNGVGFEVNITLPCYESLPEVGKNLTVLIYLHVREDMLQLYGFKSVAEREVFLNLISSPGIGPRKAQVILSSVSAENLKQYIVEENISALTSLSGVGKKTAQRLILDLKEKISIDVEATFNLAASDPTMLAGDNLINQAETALLTLGFHKNNIRNAIEKVIKQRGKELSLEELIKHALRLL